MAIALDVFAKRKQYMYCMYLANSQSYQLPEIKNKMAATGTRHKDMQTSIELFISSHSEYNQRTRDEGETDWRIGNISMT